MSGDAVMRVKSLQEPKTYDLILESGPGDTRCSTFRPAPLAVSRVKRPFRSICESLSSIIMLLPGIDCWQLGRSSPKNPPAAALSGLWKLRQLRHLQFELRGKFGVTHLDGLFQLSNVTTGCIRHRIESISQSWALRVVALE